MALRKTGEPTPGRCPELLAFILIYGGGIAACAGAMAIILEIIAGSIPTLLSLLCVVLGALAIAFPFWYENRLHHLFR